MFEDYEWNKVKPASNIVKHGLDFLDALLIFEGPHLLGSGHSASGEIREIATGLISERLVTVVFARRGTAIRIIPLRSAGNGEKR